MAQKGSLEVASGNLPVMVWLGVLGTGATVTTCFSGTPSHSQGSRGPALFHLQGLPPLSTTMRSHKHLSAPGNYLS